MSIQGLQNDIESLLEHFREPRDSLSEANVIQLLSRFPDPASVKSIKNSHGWTLLHLACCNGWYNVLDELILSYGCDPDAKTDNEETSLYLACFMGDLKLVTHLVTKYHCDSEIKEAKYGWTPFFEACSWGHLEIVKFLSGECGCDPLVSDRDGNTPLYWACNHGKYDVVSFLLTTGRLDKVSDKQFRLDRSTNTELQSLVTFRRNYPFHPAFKVFVVGNQSAGKSTLIKALENKLIDTSLFGSVTGRFKKVTGVELRTAGIIPTHVHSPKLGQIILYDFAGQYEYYSSHAACLENLVSSSGALFLLVVDLSKNLEEVVRTLQYWNSFIDNLCNRCSSKPPIVVIGSHSDVVISQDEQPTQKFSSAFSKLEGSLANSTQEPITLNCTQSSSVSLNAIGDLITTCSQNFHKECDVDIQVHVLTGLFKQHFETATNFSSIVEFVMSDENEAFRDSNLLPSNVISLSEHLTTLSEHGQLLFLKNDKDVNDSWVIFNKELLLSEVNGTIFAPEYFKQHHDIANSTGVVPLSQIKKTFPEHDPNMIVSFLTHLEFCHRTGEADRILISKDQEKSTASSSETYYFFPALISEERPEESCASIKQTSCKTGWCLERDRDDQFLTSRFLHVLLLRIAFCFALPSESTATDQDCPVVQRKCNIWKSGIHWQNNDGVEAIVEVVEQSTAVTVVIGCQKESELAGIKLRSDLIKTIFEIKEKFSGAVQVKELFIHPSELSDYPLKSTHELSTFSMDTLVSAISEGKKFVTRKQSFKQESVYISDLVYFEPFANLTKSTLKHLLEQLNRKRELNERHLNYLSEAAIGHIDKFKDILKINDTMLREALQKSRVSPAIRDDRGHHRYLVFKIWKEKDHRYCNDLREALERYSLFYSTSRQQMLLRAMSPDLSCNGVATSETYDPSTETLTDSLQSPASSDGDDSGAESESDDIAVSSLLCKNDMPTMRDLLLLKGRGGSTTLRFIATVAADWKDLATCLGVAEPVIRSIEMGAFYQPTDACRQVLSKWLEGGDELRKPITWNTLIQCLWDAGLGDVACNLESILGHQ